LALLEQAAEQAATIRFAPVLPEILGALGATYLLVGRLAETRHTAERMLQMTRASGKRPSQGDALRILAEVHAQANPGEFSQAEEAYREALAIRRADRGVTARCPLPPRPRQAVPAYGQPRAGAGAPHHCDDDVPRDGDDVLAGAGRGGDEVTGLI
jgi:Tetratricopeptide repeat